MTPSMMATYILGWHLSEYMNDFEWKTIKESWDDHVLSNSRSRQEAAEEFIICMDQVLGE